MRVSNEHTGSITRHFLLFLSITVISGRLCSSFLSVCIGKSHKILQSSDSKTFSGLYMYHFLLYWIPIFYIVSNEVFWQLCHISLICAPSALVLSILKPYVQLFHHKHYMHDRLIEHFLCKPHFFSLLSF